MRILHLVHQYGPEFIGGTELYTQMVVRLQAARGHEVSVFVPSIKAESTVEEGVKIERVAVGERPPLRVLQHTMLGQPDIQAAWESVLEREQPDMVHIEHLMGVPVALVRRLVERRIPYVVTLHDYWYNCANAQLLTNDSEQLCMGPNRFFTNCGRCALARVGVQTSLLAPAVAPLFAYRQRLLRPVLVGAARVIAPAPFVREAYGRMGVDTGNMVVIPHGIELPEVLPQRSERPDSELAGLRVVYIGGIAPQKGVHLLVEAFQQLPAETSLAIYGNVDAFPDYVAELQQLNHHPGVQFKGTLPHAEIWSVLAEADVAAVPTQWYEGFGLIVSEAFAVQTPVIASDIGVISGRVRHDVDGWLVKYDDVSAWCEALQMIIERPEMLARWRQNSRPVRTAAVHVTELLDLYAEVVGRDLVRGKN